MAKQEQPQIVTESGFSPRCSFYRSSGYSGSRCGKPANVAIEDKWDWATRKGERVRINIQYEPRCRFHASIDAGRKYSPKNPLTITPAMLKVWEQEANERAEIQRVEKARKAEQAKAHQAAAKKAAAEKATIQFAVRRDDEVTQWWGRDDEVEPRWLVEAQGQEPESRSTWDDMEVKIVLRDGQPQIQLRNSSQITPAAAKALAEALQQAVAEVTK